MMHDEDWLLTRMMFLIPLILSLSVHEWAHAWSARLLGDDTAEREGRVTLNPLAHLDPIGTILLPLLGVPFGWAKPVPINIGRFHPSVSLRSGVLLTAGAGPASNVGIAILSAGLLVLTARLYGDLNSVPPALHHLLDTLIFLNMLLAVFNLVPVPPLDGSRIVDCLIPDAWRPSWDRYAQLGPAFLLLVLFAVMLLFGADVYQLVEAMHQVMDSLLQRCRVAELHDCRDDQMHDPKGRVARVHLQPHAHPHSASTKPRMMKGRQQSGVASPDPQDFCTIPTYSGSRGDGSPISFANQGGASTDFSSAMSVENEGDDKSSHSRYDPRAGWLIPAACLT